jgi:leucyl aminopeptidase
MLVKEKKLTRFNITATKSQKDYVAKQADELGISTSEFLRDLIDSHKNQCKNEELRKAAELLANEYKSNKELTAFTAIDGDPFL